MSPSPVEVREHRAAVGVDLGSGLVVARRQRLVGDVVKVGTGSDGGAPLLGAHAGEEPLVARLFSGRGPDRDDLRASGRRRAAPGPRPPPGSRCRARRSVPGRSCTSQVCTSVVRISVELGEVRVPVLAERRPRRDPRACASQSVITTPDSTRGAESGLDREALGAKVGQETRGLLVETAGLERGQHDLLGRAGLAAVGLGGPELLGQGLAGAESPCERRPGPGGPGAVRKGACCRGSTASMRAGAPRWPRRAGHRPVHLLRSTGHRRKLARVRQRASTTFGGSFSVRQFSGILSSGHEELASKTSLLHCPRGVVARPRGRVYARRRRAS